MRPKSDYADRFSVSLRLLCFRRLIHEYRRNTFFWLVRRGFGRLSWTSIPTEPTIPTLRVGRNRPYRA